MYFDGLPPTSRGSMCFSWSGGFRGPLNAHEVDRIVGFAAEIEVRHKQLADVPGMLNAASSEVV
jgi:hypothetical protein